MFADLDAFFGRRGLSPCVCAIRFSSFFITSVESMTLAKGYKRAAANKKSGNHTSHTGQN